MFALVDCNNFYASCERIFKPELEGKPIVILSNNDGCVISRSDEAKELGIQMGTPAFMNEEFFKQNNVHVFSSNYALYGSLSNRVLKALREFTPAIEVYSIDEAFLDFSGREYHNLETLAKEIKQTINKNLGIPVSVGIAPTKTLAKMANRFAKKTKKDIGVQVLDTPDKIAEVLNFTKVGDVWGVGPQYAKLLKKNKIHSAFDLIKTPEDWIRKNMSVVGQRTLNELKGVPCIELEEVKPKKKNICVARGFGQLLKQKSEVEEALANYVAIISKKLRKENLCAKVISIFVQTNAFRKEDKQYFRSINIQLPVATNNTMELIRHANNGLNRIYREGYNYHKCGCTALDLVPENAIQFSMYDSVNRSRDNEIMKTVDKVNSVLGKDLVRVAQQGYSSKWNLRQMKLSQRYTTRINEILTIKN